MRREVEWPDFDDAPCSLDGLAEYCRVRGLLDDASWIAQTVRPASRKRDKTKPPARHRAKRSMVTQERILDYLRRGTHTQTQIANILGCSQSWVSQIKRWYAEKDRAFDYAPYKP